MLKKIGFGDDRFLPSPPPNSPVPPKPLLTPPHDAPPCQAAQPARRLQTGQLTCFTQMQPGAVSQSTAEVCFLTHLAPPTLDAGQGAADKLLALLGVGSADEVGEVCGG